MWTIKSPCDAWRQRFYWRPFEFVVVFAGEDYQYGVRLLLVAVGQDQNLLGLCVVCIILRQAYAIGAFVFLGSVATSAEAWVLAKLWFQRANKKPLKKGKDLACVWNVSELLNQNAQFALITPWRYREIGHYDCLLWRPRDWRHSVCQKKRLRHWGVTRSKPADLCLWLAQGTPFTCVPASLQIGAVCAAFPEYQADTRRRAREILAWKATTIFMTSGHGGCHPMGFGVRQKNAGFMAANVWLSEEGPRSFVDSVAP